MPMLRLCPSAAAVSVPGPILFLYVKKKLKIAYIPLKSLFYDSKAYCVCVPCVCPCL